jgi:DNA-binding NarL/FixJ family response regulator
VRSALCRDGVPSARGSRRAGPSYEYVAALSCEGLSMREIAGRLGVSHETVRKRLDELASVRT